MRETPRQRREVGTFALKLASPLFRYSAARDAYVMRPGGGHRGPVLVAKQRGVVHEATFVPQPEPGERFKRQQSSDAPS